MDNSIEQPITFQMESKLRIENIPFGELIHGHGIPARQLRDSRETVARQLRAFLLRISKTYEH